MAFIIVMFFLRFPVTVHNRNNEPEYYSIRMSYKLHGNLHLILKSDFHTYLIFKQAISVNVGIMLIKIRLIGQGWQFGTTSEPAFTYSTSTKHPIDMLFRHVQRAFQLFLINSK